MDIEVTKDELEIIIRSLHCMENEYQEAAGFWGRRLTGLMERLEKIKKDYRVRDV